MHSNDSAELNNYETTDARMNIFTQHVRKVKTSIMHMEILIGMGMVHCLMCIMVMLCHLIMLILREIWRFYHPNLIRGRPLGARRRENTHNSLSMI
jgi:hypothetical protein